MTGGMAPAIQRCRLKLMHACFGSVKVGSRCCVAREAVAQDHSTSSA